MLYQGLNFCLFVSIFTYLKTMQKDNRSKIIYETTQVSKDPWTAEQIFKLPKTHRQSYSNDAMWYL